MKKSNKRLYFSLFMLLALLVVAYIVALKNGIFDESLKANDSPQSEFAIKDTASIDKFTITKSSGETATLTRDKKEGWIINGKEKARPESILLIMQTFKNISVKTRVGAAARNNVIKNIAAFHRKVEIFKNGKLAKTWYIGNFSSDKTGSYFLLETPAMGKAEEPFIMELAGFHGQLDVRFFTEEEEWKFTGVFNYPPTSIKEIKLESGESEKDGFTLKCLPNNKLELIDYLGGKINGFDTLTARAYTYAYKKIHYEELAKKLSFNQIDSLKKIKPLFKIAVKSNNNMEKSISLYHMANYAKETDLEGNLLPYNPERAYGILSNGEIVVVQFYGFNKLLRPVSSFLKKPGL
jgi:hypothetical protein